MHALPPLNALRTFEVAARHRHLGRAAEELHVTHGAVSRQVKNLESHLGVRVFTRVGRGLQLTEAGRELYERASRIFEELAVAVERVSSHPTPTVLRVGAPRAFSARWLAAAGDFWDAHPWIELRLDSSRDEADSGAGRGGREHPLRRGALARRARGPAGHRAPLPVCAPALLHGGAAAAAEARGPAPPCCTSPTRRTGRTGSGRWGRRTWTAGAGPRFSELSAALAAAEAGPGHRHRAHLAGAGGAAPRAAGATFAGRERGRAQLRAARHGARGAPAQGGSLSQVAAAAGGGGGGTRGGRSGGGGGGGSP